MVRHRLQLTKTSKKTLLAVLLGALLGFIGLLTGMTFTKGVQLQFQNPPLPIFADAVPWQWFAVYALSGCISVGGLVAFLYERYRTALPSILVTVVYLVAVGWTGWQIHSWEGPSGPVEHFPVLPWVTPFEYLLIGWPLLLITALGSSLLERRVRTMQPAGPNSEAT